jgi:hypothetical protein
MKEMLEVRKPNSVRRVCRILSIGCTGIARCLAEPAPRCDFAVPFGNLLFCTHADRHTFEKRTTAESR